MVQNNALYRRKEGRERNAEMDGGPLQPGYRYHRTAGLVDVSPYMKKYTNMVDYYNSVDPGVMFYASGDNGIYRIPGDVAEPACETLWIRKDWLDNLGLAVPTTLDELDELKEIHGKQVEDYQKYLEEYNK